MAHSENYSQVLLGLLNNNPVVGILLSNTWESKLVIDMQHRLLFCNDSGLRMLEVNGLKVEVGTDVRLYMQEQGLLHYEEAFQKAMSGEASSRDISRIVDGKAVWFRHKLRPYHDETGTALGVVLSSTIIDGEKLATQEKETAQHHLHERIKELQTLHTVSETLHEEKKTMNDAFAEIVKLMPRGWQYPEVCNARIVFEDTEYLCDNYSTPLAVQSAEFITQDNRKGVIEIGYTVGKPHVYEGPFLKEERDLINTLAEMIKVHCNKQALETERQRMIHDLLGRNKDLEQFAFMVSHNIRAPLAHILGLAEVLSYDLSEEDKRTAFDAIVTAAKQLDKVLSDTSEIVSMKRSGAERKTVVHLQQIANETISNLSMDIRKTGAKITTDFPVITEVVTIPSYLRSIFLNAVSNSLRYAKPGVVPEIHICSAAEEENYTLTFRDNGLGLDLKRTGDKLFGLYQRFHAHVDGKGMGLFMIKTQTEIMNGSVKVESESGKGFTLIISLRK